VNNDSDTTFEQPEARVKLAIDGYLNLHTFQPSEVRELLDDYLDAARTGGFPEVVIIHGKGQGILRKRVQAILRAHPQVAGFRDAEPHRGGWGATVVRLVAMDSMDTTTANGLASGHEENACSSATIRLSGASECAPLHNLSKSQLMIGCMLGLGPGALFYELLLILGADPIPALILPYGLCFSYGLIRKADNLVQVMRRFAWISLVLGSLWFVGHLLKQVLYG
jgi:Smr domain